MPTLISAKVGTCSGVVLNYQNNRLTSKLHNNRDNYIDSFVYYRLQGYIYNMVLEKRGLIFSPRKNGVGTHRHRFMETLPKGTHINEP